MRGIGLRLVGAVAVVWLAAGAARAQDDMPDPCANAARSLDSRTCWSREVEKADAELNNVFNALLAKVPSTTAARLKKAQKLWVQFRDAQLDALYGADGRTRGHDPERYICFLIAKRQLVLARAGELDRMGQSHPDDACPL